MVRTSHDGYAENFGVIHQRALMLSADGNRLDGEDLFTPVKGEEISGQSTTVRAALPPASVGQGQPPPDRTAPC